jgi:hypothetical protein
MAAAVATMWQSSASSEGAITTMLGRHAIKVTSNEPECVGPSDPTNPALSIANLTGSFCKSTSCTTCGIDIGFILSELVSIFKVHVLALILISKKEKSPKSLVHTHPSLELILHKF